MYLPSKLRSRYIGLIAFCILLLITPFRKNLNGLFFFISQQLLPTSQVYRQKITKLQQKSVDLALLKNKLQLLQQENDQLKTALNFKKTSHITLLGVEIISFDPSTWDRVVYINAGQNRGVKPDSLVINEDGYLVGKIIDVSAHHAQLRLTSDPDFMMPVFVGENLLGYLQGDIDNAKILYIERTETVETDALVWVEIPTKTISLPVARVSKVQSFEDSLFLDIKVTLYCHNPLLDKLFVIL